MIAQNRGFTEAYKQPNSYFTTVITFCKRAQEQCIPFIVLRYWYFAVIHFKHYLSNQLC